jgi:4-amino-4-deoxy-L-arabinose transferase-like glycosyltransferase
VRARSAGGPGERVTEQTGRTTEPGRLVRAAALGAVLLVAAALRWTPADRAADLRPSPDALEYEEAARSLYAGRGYVLWIGGDAYPPRYPPGTSLLIAATMPLAGTAGGAGIFAVLGCALAAVAGTYVLAALAGGAVSGLVAALLLALSPLHVQWSRAVMSDVSASAAVVWLAAGVLVLLARRARPAAWLLAGVACGLAGSIRYVAWALLPAACATVVLLGPGRPATRAKQVAALLAGAALGVAPLLWLNAELFGSVQRDGYGYWVRDTLLAPARSVASGADGSPGNLRFYGGQLLGLGTLDPWPAGVLLLLGTVAAARGTTLARALATLAWLVAGALLALLAGFLWQWDRLLLPVLPLAVALMALPCGTSSPRRLRVLALALAGLVLLLAASVRERFSPPDGVAHDVATLRRIARIAEPNAAVLARTNAFAFARELRVDGADRVWVPLQMDVHAAAIEAGRLVPLRREPDEGGWIREAVRRPFSTSRALATVAALCREGRPVYLSEQLDLYVALLPELRQALADGFGITEVLPAEPYRVHRVACPRPVADAGRDTP